MFHIFCYAFVSTMAVVYGIPFGCSEDNQCSNGYFCDQATHLCRDCLSCLNLGRNEPPNFRIICIKSGTDCGLCFNRRVCSDGSNVEIFMDNASVDVATYYRNEHPMKGNSLVYYNGNVDAKCVPSKEVYNVNIQIYFLAIGILMILSIIVIFIKVLLNTDIIQITSLTKIPSTNYNKLEPKGTPN